MLKVREVSAAREVQTALRAEIESYKILLEREEKRQVAKLLFVLLVREAARMSDAARLLRVRSCTYAACRSFPTKQKLRKDSQQTQETC
jgi:hypothetical protein